jgi:hypothetical protein
MGTSPVTILTADETLMREALLPGFRCRVSEKFQRPTRGCGNCIMRQGLLRRTRVTVLQRYHTAEYLHSLAPAQTSAPVAATSRG